jgi:very-short-patch-repair endonuclease
MRRCLPYQARLVRRARELRRDLSPAERKLWYEFLRGLPHKFTRQKPLGRYIADFYCSKKRLVIEVDGDSHFTGRGPQHDADRTAAMAAFGLRVIRFTNLDVMKRFEAVCLEIEKALT